MFLFVMVVVLFGVIEFFIKRGCIGFGLFGVILNFFVIICVYIIVFVDINL